MATTTATDFERTPMEIRATDKRLRVDYKVPGKEYNVQNEGEGPGFNTPERSTYPFDSVDVEVGGAFNTDGVELVQWKEYEPVPEHGNTDPAG